MDCRKANDLMMKYMDETISAQESFRLKSHIGKCGRCYEDFLIYDEILSEFSTADNVISAPSDFEDAVMTKIYALGDIYAEKEGEANGLIYAVWGFISAMCGVGMLLVLNKKNIIDYFSSSPLLRCYAQYFEAAESYALQFKVSAVKLINAFADSISVYAHNLRQASFTVFIFLVLAQIIIYKRDNIEAK